jgi:ElaB/YqjD/DUF883 family membrane-anchored ribosome-binding protein
MNNPNPVTGVPKWLSRTIVALLAAQVALLWTHGSMLQRQHNDLQSLREDVQSLADSLDQEQQDGLDDGTGQDGSGSATADPAVPVPVRQARRPRARHRAPALLRVQDPGKEPSEGGEQAAKELADSRQSGKDAVAKARKTQEQLSITENYRKAEEKAALEGAYKRWLPWIAFGAAAGLAAMVMRAWLNRRS